MLQKTVNNKDYYFKEDNWYGNDKNNKPYKVTNKVLLEKLNSDGVGLGDMVAKVTKFFGVEPCQACNKRKEAMNTFKLFPHLRKDVRELDEKELELMDRILKSKMIENDDVNALFALYNSLFKTKLKRCNCPGLVRNMVQRVSSIMNIQLDKLED